mmetsp:Transcript_5244/g.14647  ORF Transcript_5244/g.14647 Transcript_5244/m.14647 type:complete len:329 (-) Transcript_5244:506-1492(-)
MAPPLVVELLVMRPTSAGSPPPQGGTWRRAPPLAPAWTVAELHNIAGCPGPSQRTCDMCPREMVGAQPQVRALLLAARGRGLSIAWPTDTTGCPFQGGPLCSRTLGSPAGGASMRSTAMSSGPLKEYTTDAANQVVPDCRASTLTRAVRSSPTTCAFVMMKPCCDITTPVPQLEPMSTRTTARAAVARGGTDSSEWQLMRCSRVWGGLVEVWLQEDLIDERMDPSVNMRGSSVPAHSRRIGRVTTPTRAPLASTTGPPSCPGRQRASMARREGSARGSSYAVGGCNRLLRTPTETELKKVPGARAPNGEPDKASHSPGWNSSLREVEA